MNMIYIIFILTSLILGIVIGWYTREQKSINDAWNGKPLGSDDELTVPAFDTPVELLEEFEDFMNSREDDEYMKGWSDCENYYKTNYDLIPIPMSGDLILSATSSPIMDKSE